MNENEIDNFEFAAYRREYPLALDHLLKLLQVTSASDKNEGYFNTPTSAKINTTRIASALMSMLSDPSFKVDWPIYSQLVSYKKTITSLFRVSGFSGTQSPLAFFSNNLPKKTSKAEEKSNIYKMLIIMGLSDHNEQTLRFLTKLDPKVSTPYILGLLSSYVVMSEQEHMIREKLLAFGAVMRGHPFNLGFAGVFAQAWMNCSYGLREDKHLLKGHLNIMMRQAMEKSGFEPPKVKLIDHTIERPRIVVLAEILLSPHAMGRCYTNYIKQLKRDFEIVLISTENEVDDNIKNLFDKTIIFKRQEKTFQEIGQLISTQKPDIIYYPSLGMNDWTIALVSFRFAPIQILTPGHPATSISDAIDYLVCDDFALANHELYSEKLLCIDNQIDNSQTKNANEDFPQPDIRENPEVLKIAVNGKSFKINASFLAACRHINSTVNRAIEWIFFPNEIGLQFEHCRLEITEQLANAQVMQHLPYNDYLRVLNRCDLAISPFPFGGSNSNVDLLRLGIPLVYLTGAEMHSRMDAIFLNVFDLPDWLSCTDVSTFCQTVNTLAEDGELRCELSHSILNQNPEDRLIKNDTTERTDFVDAVSWVWSNHETVIANGLTRIPNSLRNEPLNTNPATLNPHSNALT